MSETDWDQKHQSETVKALVTEDLAAFGIAELNARITALEGEIARCKADIESKEGTRSAAESLFKK